jgi:hypothetical protein
VGPVGALPVLQLWPREHAESTLAEGAVLRSDDIEALSFAWKVPGEWLVRLVPAPAGGRAGHTFLPPALGVGEAAGEWLPFRVHLAVSAGGRASMAEERAGRDTAGTLPFAAGISTQGAASWDGET